MNRLGRDDPLELEIFGLLLKLNDTADEQQKTQLRHRLAKLQAAKQRALADLAAESITEAQIADESLMEQGRYAKSDREVDRLVNRKSVKAKAVPEEIA